MKKKQHKIKLIIEKIHSEEYLGRSFIPQIIAIMYENKNTEPGNFNKTFRSGHTNEKNSRTSVN